MATAAAAEVVDIEGLNAAAEIRKVPLDLLKIDRSYQRDPSQALVDDIAQNWDSVSSELLLISDRGTRPEGHGGLYIVNGQHRSLGARKHGETEVWAKVIDLSQFEDPGSIEAKFRLRTNVRMGDKSLEKFKALVRSGDPDSLEIVSLLARFDTEINEVPMVDVGINAVASVQRLWEVDQGALLAETLQTIKDSFGYVGGKSTSASMMAGTAWFVVKHSEDADRDRFTMKLGETGLAAIDRRARTIASSMGGAMWLNFYRAFIEIYNERLTEGRKLKWQQGGASNFKGAASKWGAESTGTIAKSRDRSGVKVEK